MKGIAKNNKLKKCGSIILIVSIGLLLALITQLVGVYSPIIFINSNDFLTISVGVFTSMIVLGLFAGTIIAYVKSNINNTYLGFSHNEIVFEINTINSRFRANLREYMLSNYILIPISLSSLIIGGYNFLISIFFYSVLLVFIELHLSIKILIDTKTTKEKCEEIIIENLLAEETFRIKNFEAQILEMIVQNKAFTKEIDDFISLYKKYFIKLKDQCVVSNEKYHSYIDSMITILGGMINNRNVSCINILNAWQKLQDLLPDKFELDRGVNDLFISELIERCKYENFDACLFFRLLTEFYAKIQKKFDFGEKTSFLKGCLYRSYAKNCFDIYKSVNINDKFSNIEKNSQLSSLEKAFTVIALGKNHLLDAYDEQEQIPLFSMLKYLVEECDERLADALQNITFELPINQDAIIKWIVFKISYYFLAVYMNKSTPKILRKFLKKAVLPNKSRNFNFAAKSKILYFVFNNRDDTETAIYPQIANCDKIFPVEMGYWKNRVKDVFYYNSVENNYLAYYLLSAIMVDYKDLNIDNLPQRHCSIMHEIFKTDGTLTDSCKKMAEGIHELYPQVFNNPQNDYVQDIIKNYYEKINVRFGKSEDKG